MLYACGDVNRDVVGQTQLGQAVPRVMKPIVATSEPFVSATQNGAVELLLLADERPDRCP